MFYIDAHSHLDLLSDIKNNVAFEDNLPIKTISVTNSPVFFGPNNKLFQSCRNIRIGLGLHPELVLQYQDKLSLLEEHMEKARFIGEIGLDGSKDHQHSYSMQLSAFKKILAVIKKFDHKILTIHSRNAAKDTISLINEYLAGANCKVILHWYTGDLNDLKTAIGYGYYFSVNHKMIQSNKSRNLIQHMPINRILTETDAPFTYDHLIKDRLSSLACTIKGLSGVFGKSESEMKEVVYNNFKFLLR